MCNAVSSLLSDICWAYAMVLTSPLVVIVGLSLTIPLSLLGQMVIQGKVEGLAYWIGALIMVSSFVFVDSEERKDEPARAAMPVFDDDEEEANLSRLMDHEGDRLADVWRELRRRLVRVCEA
jgi:hypothetical protein